VRQGGALVDGDGCGVEWGEVGVYYIHRGLIRVRLVTFVPSVLGSEHRLHILMLGASCRNISYEQQYKLDLLTGPYSSAPGPQDDHVL
jgi:hypothetical protein